MYLVSFWNLSWLPRQSKTVPWLVSTSCSHKKYVNSGSWARSDFHLDKALLMCLLLMAGEESSDITGETLTSNSESESHSVMSDSLWLHELYSPWNSPGQNTGAGSLSLPFSRGSSQPRIKPRSPTLQMDSLPAEPQGSPRILEWVAYPFFRGSSRPRNWTRVSCIAGRFFANWAMREAHNFKGTHIQLPQNHCAKKFIFL